MNKNFLKKSLRENLGIFEADKDNNPGRKNMTGDYAYVEDAMNNIGAPSQVDVMKGALGIDDDKSGVNRSLFGKKLRREKNEDGSKYLFDDDELSKIVSFLNKKKGD
jgi:hypothetical protein